MGCLSVSIRRIGGLQTDFKCQNDITTHYTYKGGVDVDYTPKNEIDATYTKQGGMKVNLYFVCRVGTREYLRVTPEEPIWITMDESGVYTVYSNTNWIVI